MDSERDAMAKHSASSQNVSAAVEEQTATVEQVSAAANRLNDTAAQRQELVSRFHVQKVDRIEETPWFADTLSKAPTKLELPLERSGLPGYLLTRGN